MISKIWRNKMKLNKIINIQKLWHRDYNFNVNKDQLPLLASTRIFAMKWWFKSTTHDTIEFNPVFLVIVASHISPRVMINMSFTSMLCISVKDCDHCSQPDVWGNNDHKRRIKPLFNIMIRYLDFLFNCLGKDSVGFCYVIYVALYNVHILYILGPVTKIYMIWALPILLR